MLRYTFLFILSITFLTLNTTTNRAEASILLEPYGSFRLGDYGFKIKNYTGAASSLNGDYSYNINGPKYGARIGLQYFGFMAGVDYALGSISQSSVKRSPDNLALVLQDYDTTMVGAFIGYNLPFVRFWGTYILSAKWENTTATSSGTTSKGKGIGLGVGLTGLPFISINFEYSSFEFDEAVTANGQTISYPTTNTSAPKVNEYSIGVSLPFTFL